jgi:hypothetical protein
MCSEYPVLPLLCLMSCICSLDIIETNKKGQYLNTLENYHIYAATRNNTHMNNTNKDTHNPIFKELYTIYNEYTIQPHHTTNQLSIKEGTNTLYTH